MVTKISNFFGLINYAVFDCLILKKAAEIKTKKSLTVMLGFPYILKLF